MITWFASLITPETGFNDISKIAIQKCMTTLKYLCILAYDIMQIFSCVKPPPQIVAENPLFSQ